MNSPRKTGTGQPAAKNYSVPEINEAEIKYHTLFEQSPDGILIIDADGRILDFNEAAYRQLGFSREEFADLKISDINPSESPEAMQARIKRLLNGEKAEFEVKHRTKEGEIRDVHVITQQIVLSGRIVFHAIWRDITERKQAEQAIRQSEEKFRTLFESATDALFILDPEGYFIDVNRTAYERLGYTKEELLSRHISQLDPPEFAAKVSERIKHLMKHGHAVFESAHLKKDGTVMPVEINARIIDYEGRKAVFSIIRDITERKKAESSLRLSGEAIESLPIGITICDLEGKIIYVNPAEASIHGYTVAELINKDVRILAPPELRRPISFEGIYKMGIMKRESVNIRKNGEAFSVQLTSLAVKGEDGSPIGIITISEDISRRKGAEEKLKFFSQAVDEAIDGIHLVDLSGRIFYANRANEKIYGFSAKELVGRHVKELNADKEYDEAVVMSSIKKTGRWDGELNAVRKDGRIFPIWLTTTLIKDDTGNPIAMLGIIRDITERKQAEETLKGLNARLQALIRAIPDMVVFKDSGGRHLIVNKALEELTGLSQKELIGKTNADLLPPDLAEACTKSDEEVLKSRSPLHFEEHYTGRDGEKGYLDTVKAPIFDDLGNVAGTVTVSREITDRKKIEERIKASLEEKEVLLKEIHHRVKNNLNVIASLLNLQARYIGDTKFLDIFQDCQNRIRSMALIHEKLYERGDLLKIDFKEYIVSLISSLSALYADKTNNIGFKTNIQNIALDIDTSIPCGLIINELVTNSLKHAFRDRNDGQISIAFRSAGRDYALSIKDDGVGLRKDFDLARAETLGLQLVDVLTKQLGGTLEIIVDGGTEFRITFEGQSSKSGA